MAETGNARIDWRRARSGERGPMRLGRGLYLTAIVCLPLGIAIAGCATPRAGDPPSPCPVPSATAVEQMDSVGDELAVWLGRMLRYCEGIDELRK